VDTAGDGVWQHVLHVRKQAAAMIPDLLCLLIVVIVLILIVRVQQLCRIVRISA